MKTSIIFAVIAALILTACGNSSAPEGNTEQTQAEVQASSQQEETAPPETQAVTETTKEEDPVHTALVDRSLYSLGNTTRLKAKMEQARRGEKTTVAFIGGSITEGAGGTAQSCYAYKGYEHFAKRYGTGNNVEYVNAGLSGTPSALGVLRLERDVLNYEPDIVFVEFAVNDSMDKRCKEGYESLVKTVLSRDNEPAVVLFFNRLEGGYSAQAQMKEIGEFYDLPMISAADALTPEFDEGRMAWKDYSGDYAHPNVLGHRLLGEFIDNLYVKAENSESGEYVVRQGGKFGTPFENSHMVTPDMKDDVNVSVEDTGSFEEVQKGSPGFPVSWKFTEGNSPLKFKAKASAFFVIFKRNKTEDMGVFDVYIDGEKIKTVDTCQQDGWGEAFSEQIIKYQTVHDIEVEILPAEGNEGKDIEILGIAYCQNVTF